eukprot:3160770-Amphidinium_carterae.1
MKPHTIKRDARRIGAPEAQITQIIATLPHWFCEGVLLQHLPFYQEECLLRASAYNIEERETPTARLVTCIACWFHVVYWTENGARTPTPKFQNHTTRERWPRALLQYSCTCMCSLCELRDSDSMHRPSCSELMIVRPDMLDLLEWIAKPAFETGLRGQGVAELPHLS